MSNSSKALLAILVTMVLTSIGSVSHAGNFYEGKYQDWVNKLLNAAGAWDCDSYSKPPIIKADGSERDKQVAAAVTSAWQAECLARDGEAEKAGAAAEDMFNHLKTAAGMCHKASPSQMGEGQKSCDTESIFDCEVFQP